MPSTLLSKANSSSSKKSFQHQLPLPLHLQRYSVPTREPMPLPDYEELPRNVKCDARQLQLHLEKARPKKSVFQRAAVAKITRAVQGRFERTPWACWLGEGKQQRQLNSPSRWALPCTTKHSHSHNKHHYKFILRRRRCYLRLPRRSA